MKNTANWIAVLDFGSPNTQLIARYLRNKKVYSEILRFDVSRAELLKRRPAGIILSGAAANMADLNLLQCDPALFDLGIPVLGIAHGMRVLVKSLGGSCKAETSPVCKTAFLNLKEPSILFKNLPQRLKVWADCSLQIENLPVNFTEQAAISGCRYAAIANQDKHIYGLQFHPESRQTAAGQDIFDNFIFEICKCQPDWTPANFIAKTVKDLRKKIGKSKVVCGLSGGVDSAVTAALLHQAIGKQLHCIFVDTGLLRAGEAADVEKTFKAQMGFNLQMIDASRDFLHDLKGVTDPEKKRKLIGKRFIETFSAAARQLEAVKFLAQGTLYPDVIESVCNIGNQSLKIKSHHNVGGLPPDLNFELVEPLRELFKDEVRQVGRELGIPAQTINRQPFPGPGLAVRILGEVTAQNVALLQKADQCIQAEFAGYAKKDEIWQAFGVLLPVKSVGVKDGKRTYANTLVLRAVTSEDGMQADWARLPLSLLAKISSRVTNDVAGINRVVYDISSKPPATIEWE